MLICTPEGLFNGPEHEFDSLDAAKADRYAHINAHAYRLRQALMSATHPGEMASWWVKLAEARHGGGPQLAAEAEIRGVPEEELVARVLKNARSMTLAESSIAGVAGRHRDAVKALDTIEAVMCYDFSQGWLFTVN